MKITELALEAYSIYFSDNPCAFKKFTQDLKLKWQIEGREPSYYYWFLERVALPRIYEESERRKPGSIYKEYWESFNYLKYLENKLKYQGRSTEHLQLAIARWHEVFREQKRQRQAAREYWDYA